jgi:hypothetical protein
LKIASKFYKTTFCHFYEHILFVYGYTEFSLFWLKYAQYRLTYAHIWPILCYKAKYKMYIKQEILFNYSIGLGNGTIKFKKKEPFTVALKYNKIVFLTNFPHKMFRFFPLVRCSIHWRLSGKFEKYMVYSIFFEIYQVYWSHPSNEKLHW